MTLQIFVRPVAKPRRDDRVLLACGFAFTTGWVDVLCTLHFGAFGTMMTGNSIYLAKSVSHQSVSEALFYLSAIVAYAAGAWLNCYLNYQLGRRQSASAIAVPGAPGRRRATGGG